MLVVMSLMSMLLLTPLMVAFITLGATEAQISSNHLRGAQARALAESATERAYHSVVEGAPILEFEGPLASGSIRWIMSEVSPTEYKVDGFGYVPADIQGAARRHVSIHIVYDSTAKKWVTTMWREVAP